MIGRMRNLRPRLSGNGQVADEAIAQADRALALAEEMADAGLSTAGELAEARARITRLESDLAIAARMNVVRAAEVRRLWGELDKEKSNNVLLTDRLVLLQDCNEGLSAEARALRTEVEVLQKLRRDAEPFGVGT